MGFSFATTLTSPYDKRASTVNELHHFLSKAFLHLKIEEAALSVTENSAHYDDKAQNLEGVARLLWGAVPISNEYPEFVLALSQAVAKGVDPYHSAYWGGVSDYNQRCVEMSAIAVAVIDAKTSFFDSMTNEQKKNLTAWLQSSTNIHIPNNNWHFFRILILMALHLVGEEINKDVLHNDLNEINEMYLGHGWYRDGRSGCTDYYNPYAFHFYGLIFSRWVLNSADDFSLHLVPIAKQFVARAAEFAVTFSLWNDEEGAQIGYGRSMSYRFAGAGLWPQLCDYPEIIEAVGLSINQLKTLWVNSLTWWGKKSIIQNDTYSVGYAYPNLIVSEIYNSPCSPLLALKGYFAVQLPQEHVFWQTERDSDMTIPSVAVVHETKQIVQRNHNGSILLTGAPSAAELRNSHDKYLKFSYSSSHGFCVEALQWIDIGFLGDNVFACYHQETKSWKFRKKIISSEIDNDRLITIWSPFDGCEIRTVQQFIHFEEIRTHYIQCNQTIPFIISGYAVDKWTPCIGHKEPKENNLIVGKTVSSQLKLIQGHGFYEVMPCAPNTNTLFSQTSVPIIYGDLPKGYSILETKVISNKNM